MSVSGTRETINNLRALGFDVDKAIAQAIFATMQQVRTTAVKSIQSQSPGRTVTRISQDGRPYRHVASLPGDAPNTDTGALVRSIAVEPPAPAQTMFVGSGLGYALELEMGRVGMAPRPWLMPATDANLPNLPKNIAKALRRAVNERQ